MGFVDLHSHVLPALDDGAADLESSLGMLRGLAALGFDTVAATPHQKAGQFMPARDAIDGAHAAVRTALAAARVELALPLAAENMWDAVFQERMLAGAIPRYAGGPAFLVELPIGAVPLGMRERVFELRQQGLLPVLAHPERYQPFWDDRDALLAIGQECPLVVDLGAIAGYHGRREAKAARWLVAEGLAHAVASDAHTAGDVRIAAEGIAWIHKRLGAAAVSRLLDDGPRRILAGEHPAG